MKLSDWRAAAPARDAFGSRVTAVVEPVLAAFGTGRDPHGWVAWGDEPGSRFVILAPASAGLVVAYVRVNIPGEGPRVSAKLVRWSRVQIGELGFETQAGHRLASFQVEGQVIRGADATADLIAEFALAVMSGMDGRQIPEFALAPPAPDLPASGSGSGRGRQTPRARRPAAARAPAEDTPRR